MHVDYLCLHDPHQIKSTEEVIKAYLKNVYSIVGCSKYILSERGGEISSKQFTCYAEELGFIIVHTSSHTPAGN